MIKRTITAPRRLTEPLCLQIVPFILVPFAFVRFSFFP
jgi:hypothetical protein